MKFILFLTIFGIISIRNSQQLDNGLSLTPPMGWMSWERFRCNVDCVNDPSNCISEDLIINQAFMLVKLGLDKVGYKYIAIDDCWLNKSRDSSGNLVPDSQRFPNGMKYIGDVLHKLGLQFGLYEDFGTKTCGGYPGSLNDMARDINSFVSWGVDYIKLDGCYSDTAIQPNGYAAYERLLNQSKRPIVFSCSWPAYYQVKNINSTNQKLLIDNCNLWRMYGDIQDSWSSVLSIINFYKSNPNNFSSWAGPGHWNDPDMLILGNKGLNYDQERIQMGMWAIFAAPLMMSTDLRNINKDSVALLSNTNILSINQDSLGIQGEFVMEINSVQIWKRSLSENQYAIAVVNVNNVTMDISLTLNQTQIPYKKGFYTITEAFNQKDKTNILYDTVILFELNPTSIEMIKILS